jgi:hypothetical protein
VIGMAFECCGLKLGTKHAKNASILKNRHMLDSLQCHECRALLHLTQFEMSCKSRF